MQDTNNFNGAVAALFVKNNNGYLEGIFGSPA
jgi:hypothetical protein